MGIIEGSHDLSNNVVPEPLLTPVTEGSSSAGRARKTAFRGESIDFKIGFYERGTNTPMVPLDSTKYPIWGIYSPSGVLIDSGVMQSYGAAGTYRVSWTVPITSELSNDKSSYLFQVTFINQKHKQFQNTMDFDVLDRKFTSSNNTDLVELGIEGMPYRAIFRADFSPVELYLQMFFSNRPNRSDSPIKTPISMADMTMARDGDSIVYYYDIPGSNLTKSGNYTLLWAYRDSELSQQNVQYTQYRVVPKSFLQYLPSLRFITERLPLDPNMPQKLSDADLMEGMVNGIRDLNSYNPISSYSISNVPSTLVHLWTMCSLRWLFFSQYVTLGGIASFNFSGGSTSLDYDQSGIMDNAIGKLDSYIQERVGPAKSSTLRMMTPNAVIGLRSDRPYGYSKRVIKYADDMGSGYDSMSLTALTSLGIMP